MFDSRMQRSQAGLFLGWFLHMALRCNPSLCQFPRAFSVSNLL